MTNSYKSDSYRIWNPDGIYFIPFSFVDLIYDFIRNTYKDILAESIIPFSRAVFWTCVFPSAM